MRDNMHRDERMNTDHRTAAGGDGSRIARLDELDGYKVADGEPDIRGWDVKTRSGQNVGKVKELIVDVDAMKVRYLDVKLDRKAVGLAENRHVLVPIGTARLDDDRDDVIIRESATDLREAPPYDPRSFTPEYERGVRGWYGSRTTASAGAPTSNAGADNEMLFDDAAFWGKRRGMGRATYLTRSEEQLSVGKRQVQAGEVDVRKRVETERVKQQVPVTREEVTVERRPVNAAGAGAGNAGGEIGDEDIRVPLMAEELVVDKRAVPKEEVIIRKRAVQETKTVEADVRKERVEVDPKGDVEARQAK